MKYINISEYGRPEVLSVQEGETPSVSTGQVLIKVAAAGLNRADIVQRLGKYPPPPGASEILGLEVSGEIVSIANDVENVCVGDQVCALLPGGGYAEYAIADAKACLPVPKNLSLIEAATIPETFFTVWSNVFDRAKLKSGQSILIHGGGSGIGTTAIQLAKAFGAKVFTTVGSKQKCDFCRQLGAELAINYNDEDFVSIIKQATNGKGVNVVLDMVAGDYIDKNIQLTAADGFIVLIAGLGGFKAEVDFLPVMLKRLNITGSTLRARPVEFKAKIAADLHEKVWPLLESKQVSPVIYKTLPLSEAAEAHRIMESSQHIGKIVLIP